MSEIGLFGRNSDWKSGFRDCPFFDPEKKLCKLGKKGISGLGLGSGNEVVCTGTDPAVRVENCRALENERTEAIIGYVPDESGPEAGPRSSMSATLTLKKTAGWREWFKTKI